jgi:hypothetical protein
MIDEQEKLIIFWANDKWLISNDKFLQDILNQM